MRSPISSQCINVGDKIVASSLVLSYPSLKYYSSIRVKSKDWSQNRNSNRASTIREKRLVTKYFYEPADYFCHVYFTVPVGKIVESCAVLHSNFDSWFSFARSNLALC